MSGLYCFATQTICCPFTTPLPQHTIIVLNNNDIGGTLATTAVIDFLQKLIALTSEREPLALELALIKAISHFCAQDTIVLYHLTAGAHNDNISALNSDGKQITSELSDIFKSHLISCFKSSQPTTLDNTETDGHITYLYPLKNNKNHITAVIAVATKNTDSDIDLTIKSLLQIYQNYIGLINENERDTLTGLLNRKTFEAKINKVFSALLSQHTRKGDSIGQKNFLAIFDIDHFKRVNDEFGHLIGDEVLLMFSQLMTQTFREQDMLFRFGGEEFIAIFECPSADDMARVINRFREKVSAFNFPQIGKVTVSAGYTEIQPLDTSSLLIDRADAALYFAKNNGRNRAHNFEELVATGHLTENKVDSDIELF